MLNFSAILLAFVKFFNHTAKYELAALKIHHGYSVDNRVHSRRYRFGSFHGREEMKSLIALAAIFLCACASMTEPKRWPAPSDYWERTREPIANTWIMELEDPTLICTGSPAQAGVVTNGCFRFTADSDVGYIFIRADLKGDERACVLRHEERHRDGYMHPKYGPVNFIDCGDGTMLVF
jgi:hypothetical protein